MSNIIRVDFGNSCEKQKFSADVYSSDMKKYQFQASANSTSEAYRIFVSEAARHSVQVIKCIAVYRGYVDERKPTQPPERVWHQKSRSLKNCV